MRRLSAAVLAALLLGLAVGALPVVAGSSAKVVVVVGPVGDHNAHYKSDARDIAAEARKHTSNVVTLFTPNATWSAVKAAAQGASVFVYLGHGNGWPSIYPPFQTVTKDGLGLDPSTGADGSQARLLRRGLHPGQHPVRAQRGRPALPPVLRVGQHRARAGAGHVRGGARAGRQLRRRVHRRRRAGGDRGGPPRPPGHLRDPPAVHDQADDGPGLPRRADVARPPAGPVRLRSARPASRSRWTPTRATPSGFYRSIVGDLGLRASEVTGPLPASDRQRTPRTSSSRARPRSTDPDGVGLFGSLRQGAGPVGHGRAPRSRARPGCGSAANAAPASDGTRVFARHRSWERRRRATSAPRASRRATRSATAVWSLDRSAAAALAQRRRRQRRAGRGRPVLGTGDGVAHRQERRRHDRQAARRSTGDIVRFALAAHRRARATS